MMGILVQLTLSWLIVWFYNKGNLSVLGLQPNRKRLAYSGLFFMAAALACAVGFLFRYYFAGERWRLNPSFSFGLLAAGFWWTLKSVLFEELIFRGVLFYILIRKLGAAKAIVISAATFGVYHWFSWQQWGHPQQMAITFFVTGAVGLLYAYAYVKTGSLYAPIGLHLGWNFTQGFIFSNGSIGNGVLVQQPGPAITVSYLAYAAIFVLPLLLKLVWGFCLLRSTGNKLKFGIDTGGRCVIK